jgi:hypothetical protein
MMLSLLFNRRLLLLVMAIYVAGQHPCIVVEFGHLCLMTRSFKRVVDCIRLFVRYVVYILILLVFFFFVLHFVLGALLCLLLVGTIFSFAVFGREDASYVIVSTVIVSYLLFVFVRKVDKMVHATP